MASFGEYSLKGFRKTEGMGERPCLPCSGMLECCPQYVLCHPEHWTITLMKEPTVPNACWMPRHDGRALVVLRQSFQSLLFKTDCSWPGLCLHHSPSKAWVFEMLCLREPYGLGPFPQMSCSSCPSRSLVLPHAALGLDTIHILRCLRVSALSPVCLTSSPESTATSVRGYLDVCHQPVILALFTGVLKWKSKCSDSCLHS